MQLKKQKMVYRDMKKNVKKYIIIINIILILASCAKKEDSSSNASSTSSNDLIITEVSSTRYTNAMPWFELYNKSTTSVDLSEFSLKSLGVSTSNNLLTLESSTTFTFPSVTLPAGSYIVVKGKYTTTTYISDSAGYIELSNSSGVSPAWNWYGGFLEILGSNGETVDFVVFGSDTSTPTTSTEWTGDAADKPSFWYYGRSIARDGSNTDTNTKSDWTQKSYATFGGPNDVTCSTDDDSDGIPDCSEISGSTYAGLDLYSFGARQDQKDIFVEIDYMDSTDPGIIPRKVALDKVKEVFAKNNYVIHFDVGNLIDNDTGIDPDNYDLGGGNEVTYVSCLKLRKTDGCSGYLDDIKYKNFDLARKSIFYYMLFGNSQNSDGSGGSSGLAEMFGNDSIITIGNWGLTTSSASRVNAVNNYMAGTILHEFGHNLGLYHGGGTGVNYKPNYLSSMNYLYQLAGLPPDNKTGDRYYYENYSSDTDCWTGSSSWDLSGGPDNTSMVINYSDGSGDNLTESSQAESIGLGRSGATAVDFNCDGDTSDNVSMNLNPDYDNSTTDNLSDYNDWGNISIIFNLKWSGQSSRTLNDFSNSNKHNQVKIPKYSTNIIWHDKQPVAKEYAPNQKFFQTLHKLMNP